jgi:hypothetical protein
MKLVSLLALAVIGFFLFSPSLLLAESASLVEIKSITHSIESEEQETIRFELESEVSTRMFALKGDRPRLVIDFPESIYKGKNEISIDDGALANTIRIGLHNEPKSKTRVVIDLSKTYAVEYKHSFIESENLLEVVLTRGAIQKALETVPEPEKKPAVAETVEPASVAAEKELVSLPIDEKHIPPAFTTPVEPTKIMENEDVPPGVPQLLEVSFDDSSNRGEMVLFHLNDFFPPTVSAIEKNNPRVLCDFKNMRLSRDVQATIQANGKYVEGVRTAYHADKDTVRVVLDLSPDRDYDLQQVFFKNDNLFVLIVNELPAQSADQ